MPDKKLSIKHWRQIRDITQPEMAEMLGIHVNTYRRMERMPMHIKLITLLNICEILRIKIGDIDLTEFAKEGNESAEAQETEERSGGNE